MAGKWVNYVENVSDISANILCKGSKGDGQVQKVVAKIGKGRCQACAYMPPEIDVIPNQAAHGGGRILK